jgi:hypothetical protein
VFGVPRRSRLTLTSDRNFSLCTCLPGASEHSREKIFTALGFEKEGGELAISFVLVTNAACPETLFSSIVSAITLLDFKNGSKLRRVCVHSTTNPAQQKSEVRPESDTILASV